MSADVLELIAEQVATRPHAVAVVDETRQWTYQQLSDEADRLGASLTGVGPGDHVGVHMGRRGEVAVAVLAILRRGAAYVPLDPEYPRERLRYIAEDAGLRAVLAEDEQAAGDLAVPVMTLGAQPEPAAPVAVAPADAAYVVYTSGSTGKPKGVVVAHGGLANVLRFSRERMVFGPADSVLAMASFSFDFSVLELLLPLVSGGTLHLMARSVARDPDALSTALAERGITFLMGTPSMFGSMFAAGWQAPAGLTYVAGGEALPASTARLFGQAKALWNIYGPTETSIFCTCERVDNPDDITIGLPIDGVPVKIVGGEIWVGGIAVANGYHNRPELTAERFIDGWYRTGDLGRWRQDGRIDYAGRADDQVKIRGFRVELGAIEEALRGHPAVQEAAVVVDRRTEVPLLVAFVVGDARPDELRAHLSELVPPHEVPRHILPAEVLPRGANGKTDRLALAARLGDASITGQLARIWREVLGVDQIGLGDSFFEIGGDSLSLLRMVGRARSAGLRFLVKDVYRRPTVSALAEVVTRTADLSTVEPMTGPIPLLPRQSHYLDRGLANPSHFNEPIVIGVKEPMDREILAGCLRTMAERHPALCSRFVEQDGKRWVERASAEGAFPLSWFDLRDAAAERYRDEMDRLADGLDLFGGPVCQAAYFMLGDEDILFLQLHHMVCDGISLHTLTEELTALYESQSAGTTPELPAPPPSALAYAACLHKFANSGEPERAVAEWLSLPWQDITPVPAERPDGSRLAERIRTVSTSIDVANLLTVSRRSVVTFEDVLLAALSDAMATVTGGHTVAIDVVRHGRQPDLLDIDISRTIGWLGLITPFVVTVPTGASPAAKLNALRRQVRALGEIEHAWAALRYLHDDPAVTERLAALPERQLFLNFRGAGMDSLPLAGRFRRLDAYVGRQRLPDYPQPYAIELRSDVVDDRLRFKWTYSADIFQGAQIERLAEACQESIADFAAAVPATGW